MFYDGNGDNNPAVVRIPHFRNFDIKNVICDGAKDALFVRGLADAPIQSITLTNISVASEQALKMENADGFTLTNVWLDFGSGPVLTVKDAKNIQLNQTTTAAQADLFVRASGAGTSNVQVLKSDAANAKKDVELAPEVKPGAVVFK
jgi:DNA sulfur modification protein DndE